MNEETVNLLSLGEHDEELQKKIVADVERIIEQYLAWNIANVSILLVQHQQTTIERYALRALKNHLNNSGNIY